MQIKYLQKILAIAACICLFFLSSVGCTADQTMERESLIQTADPTLGRETFILAADAKTSDEKSADAEAVTAAAKEPQLYARAAVLLDGDTGRILYAKNPEEQMANASTTKILTCLLAIEEGNLDQICTVSSYACTMPETKCGFREGAQFRLEDLLYALMLESHNDAAVVIAESIGGSVEGFAEKMNAKAEQLGCEHSYFITPNGLDAEDDQGFHGSSAHDLAVIMNACRKNETFLKITQTMEYSFQDASKQNTYTLQNKNQFLTMEAGTLTGKTGYTSKAGYCYVCAYQKDGRNYSLALLACGWPNHKTYKWADAKALIAYGNAFYDWQTVGDSEQFYQISIPRGVSQSGSGFSYRTETKLVNDGKQQTCLIGNAEEITAEILCEPVNLPVEKGKTAGKVGYYLNDNLLTEQELFYTETIVEADLPWCVRYVFHCFLQS